MPYRVERSVFEELAEEAFQTLPEKFKKRFENTVIVVEDYPGKDDTDRLKSTKGLLLGLYSGVPYPEKRGFFSVPYPLPDRIILFQKNIESICADEKELIRQIQATLLHEIGHYFGLSEADLKKYN